MSAVVRPLRLAILCSFNLELISRNLKTVVNELGFDTQLYFSGYGQWEMEGLNPASGIYQFAPDLVFVFPEFADLVPPLANATTLETEAQAFGKSAWQRIETVVKNLLYNLPSHSLIYCHNTTTAPVNPLGILEGNNGYSFTGATEIFNSNLRQYCGSQTRLLQFDYANLVCQHGWKTWYDNRLWHLGRMRLTRTALNLLAQQYARYIAAQLTPRRKCLVLDLDNTLWGGVVGEDGLSGIELGHEKVGLAFREFQMAVLALAQRGVILAICSKNNPNDALAVLREHPDAVLRPEHFACMEINWEPKSENLRLIAQRLNIGLDSLVFWDDSPVEREIVSQHLPEVLVVDVPDDPSEYAVRLLNLECFDILSLTDEDQRRGEMYRQQAQRQDYLQQSESVSLEEFYTSLAVKVQIERATEFTLPRIAQLTQRTNQFNFTTRRYSENEVQILASDRNYHLYSLQLQDRFGDLGIVGAAVIRDELGYWHLENFLMSCRALGRNVEDAFFAYLVSQAENHGSILTGIFKPTAKNAPSRAFLAKYNIAPPDNWEGDWKFKVPNGLVAQPTWIEIAAVPQLA